VKVYVLLSHVDHEGRDVLAVYRDKSVAEAWKQWCYENNSAIRDSIGEPGGMYDREWKTVFGRSLGDSYSVEEHDTRAAMPPTPAITGPGISHDKQ
jgi:hypothetical protein